MMQSPSERGNFLTKVRHLMSEVETEKSTMGGWKAAAILGATAAVGIWAAVTVLPVIAAHLVLSTLVLGGAAAAVGYKKDRRDAVLSFGSKVKDFYKDAFKGFRSGWKKGKKALSGQRKEKPLQRQPAKLTAAHRPSHPGKQPTTSKPLHPARK
jgi:hypothetical protein